MLKTLLILSGVLIVSATGLQAQGASASHFASARPAAYRGFNHTAGYSHGNGYRRGGYRGHYFFLDGTPYFYPFGFGYPYYGGFYGDGFGYGYGAGYAYGGDGGGYPYGDGAYNGRLADNGDGIETGKSGQPGGGSLPEAVQRQLVKRGYYKGSVDGQFGPASRSALSGLRSSWPSIARN